MPLPNFSDNIEKNIFSHIKYRDAIRNGEVVADNGDGTYDVKIALSGEIYPNIETLEYEAIFAVGEMAVLAFEYGCKESPKIIGHGKKIAQVPVEVEVDYSGMARVETLNAYSVTSTTAYLEARIYLSGGAGNCTRRGFQYGTTTAYGLDTYTDGSYGSGSYAIQITNLTGETTYHFRAYIIDEDGDTQYGGDKTFITSAPVLGDIYICYWTGSAGNEVGYIKSFTSDGVAGTSWTAEDYQLLYNGACVDSSDNIYYIANTQPNHTIVKYNTSGAEIESLIVSYQAMHIAIANDGYIYTLENTQTDNNMMTKRNPTTLAEISSFQMDPSHSYYGMAFFDDDRFYVVNSSDDVIEMWRVETGGEIGEVAVDSKKTSLASLAKTGATVLGTDFAKQPWWVPTNLSAGEIDWSTEITRCFSVTSKDGYFYVFGNNVNGEELYLGKYAENGTKQWLVEAVPTGYYPSTVAAYPF